MNTDCLHIILTVNPFLPRPPPFSSFSVPSSPPIVKTHLFFLESLHRPPGLTGSPVISDISLIRLSPHAAAGTGESPFSPPHPYVNPHMEHYLRVHSSPTLSMISAARGLSPAEGKVYRTSHCKTWTKLSTYNTDTIAKEILTRMRLQSWQESCRKREVDGRRLTVDTETSYRRCTVI